MVRWQAHYPLRSTGIRDSTPAPLVSAGVSVCLYVCMFVQRTWGHGPARSPRVPQVIYCMCFRTSTCVCDV
jgi:hypothetical protein